MNTTDHVVTEQFLRQCEEAMRENESLRQQLAETYEAAVLEGWQLVPKEPTPEMLKAAGLDYESADYTGAGSMYKAMLAAAPQS